MGGGEYIWWSEKQKGDFVMEVIERLIKKIKNFRDERDWEKFHNPKDLALGLNIEAAELLELYLWKNPEDADVERVKEELADVFVYALLISEKYSLNIEEIVSQKIERNAKKYPVDKSKGTAKKYNEL